MNLLDWEDALRRLPRNLGPHHQSGVNYSTASTTRDTYCEYSRYTVDELHSIMGVNVGRKELTPPFHNLYSKKSEVEDPDGKPLEMDEEDPELARKRKELREIEEQIMCKKVAIALKTTPIVKKTTSAGFSCNEQSATCKGATLRDRVNVILQQRHSLSFVTKSAQERMKSSSLSEGVVRLEDHPLKLRVKALMRQRCRDPCALPTNSKVRDVTRLPPSQSVTSPAQEESSVNKGFQHFLSMLNKGVDIDLLNRIVNDDSEDLPLGEDLLNIQSPVVESKSHLPCQQSNSGALLQGRSQTKSGERKTDPLSQAQSHNESHSLPDEEEKKNDRGHRSFGSSSRSKSPPAVMKKKKEEEEVKPKADEQHEQLQNILKTLGLSLEVDEMNKLSDRTQERLYGKKHEGGQRADGREEQDSRPRGSHRHYSKSSSSSSSSSRSTSRSFSPSPSRHPCFHRSDSSNSRERGRASERSRSRDRNRDVFTCQDGSQDGKKAQRHMDKETSSFQHPYPQNQSYSSPHPPAFPAFSDYSLAQYPQHTAYHTYTQDTIPSPFHPSWYPYPQNTYHHFSGPVMAPNMVYPHDHPFEDINLLMNPDLSKSEGQIGSSSGLRCLQVISTKQSKNQSCLKQVTKGRKRKKKGKREKMRHRLWLARKKEKKKLAAKQSKDSVKRLEAPQDKKEDSDAEQSEEGKRQPTEEEIKANLRKKLEAFNQMVKQKVTQPANS